MRMITKICYMYYFQDEIQTKIAKKFNITRQMVSKIVQRAREEGIVEIKIKSPVVVVTELESILEKTFDLKDVVVIQNDTLDDDHLLEKLGDVSGEYFVRNMMPNMKVGIGIGASMESMATYISESGLKNSLQNTHLLQLVGGVQSNHSWDNSQYIINNIAKKLGCHYDLMYLPFMTENEAEYKILRHLPATEALFDQYNQLDCAFVEIRPAEKAYQLAPDKQQKARHQYLNSLGVSYLNNIDVSGEICLNYLNDRGRFVETPISNKIQASTVNP